MSTKGLLSIGAALLIGTSTSHAAVVFEVIDSDSFSLSFDQTSISFGSTQVAWGESTATFIESYTASGMDTPYINVYLESGNIVGLYLTDLGSSSFSDGDVIVVSNLSADVSSVGFGAAPLAVSNDPFPSNADIIGGDNSLQFASAAVPEPSSTALLGIGGLGLLMRRKRASL